MVGANAVEVAGVVQKDEPEATPGVPFEAGERRVLEAVLAVMFQR